MGRPSNDQMALRRMEADVQIVQAQVEAMSQAVVNFGEDLHRLTGLVAQLTELVNRFAGDLAVRRNK
jgi:hypothetical protein